MYVYIYILYIYVMMCIQNHVKTVEVTFKLWFQLLWHTVILLWLPKKAQQKNNLARLIVYFCSIVFHKNHELVGGFNPSEKY